MELVFHHDEPGIVADRPDDEGTFVDVDLDRIQDEVVSLDVVRLDFELVIELLQAGVGAARRRLLAGRRPVARIFVELGSLLRRPLYRIPVAVERGPALPRDGDEPVGEDDVVRAVADLPTVSDVDRRRPLHALDLSALNRVDHRAESDGFPVLLDELV